MIFGEYQYTVLRGFIRYVLLYLIVETFENACGRRIDDYIAIALVAL